MNVTRQVISDLWPLYATGQASADTRALVDTFLAGDASFAASLRASPKDDALAAHSLPPGHQLLSLSETQRNLWGYGSLLSLALLFTFIAFGRVASQMMWIASSRLNEFLVTAPLAVVCWTAFLVKLWRHRARVMIAEPIAPAAAAKA
ncbi:MAG: hypothetical protein ABIT71_26740 [Vicinamibacteraceae bacterium]